MRILPSSGSFCLQARQAGQELLGRWGACWGFNSLERGFLMLKILSVLFVSAYCVIVTYERGSEVRECRFEGPAALQYYADQGDDIAQLVLETT